MTKFIQSNFLRQYYNFGDDWLSFHVFIVNTSWVKDVTDYLKEQYNDFKYNNEQLEIGSKYVMIVDGGRQGRCSVKFVEYNKFLSDIKEQFNKNISLFEKDAKKINQ